MKCWQLWHSLKYIMIHVLQLFADQRWSRSLQGWRLISVCMWCALLSLRREAWEVKKLNSTCHPCCHILAKQCDFATDGRSNGSKAFCFHLHSDHCIYVTNQQPPTCPFLTRLQLRVRGGWQRWEILLGTCPFKISICENLQSPPN